MRPRVLIMGHDEPGSLMRSYAGGFRERGLSVETYCLAKALASITRLPRRRPVDVALARRRGARLSRKVVDDHRGVRADLALVLKGEYLRAEAVSAMRVELGCPVINLYPDDPFSGVAVNRLVFGPAVLRAYDGRYTFSRRLVGAYRRAGVSEVEWLPFARDPALHAPFRATGPPKADVVFVGNFDQARAEWLSALERFRVVVHGDLRINRRMARRVRGLRGFILRSPAVGPEMSRALANGAISVNVLREQNKGSHNMRSFESLACGAFTISEDSEEIRSLFEDGVHLVTVRDPAELAAAAVRWLRDPVGRARIAEAGFRRVEHDTYTRRCDFLLERWLS
jgi:glycosyltransferase involved in cell wall biosynthesis